MVADPGRVTVTLVCEPGLDLGAVTTASKCSTPLDDPGRVDFDVLELGRQPGNVSR